MIFELEFGVARVKIFGAKPFARLLRHDFSGFSSTKRKSKDLLNVFCKPLPSCLDWGKGVPTGYSTLYRPKKRAQRVSFFGEVWVEYSFGDRRATLFYRDEKLGYEILTELLLSFLGEASDRQGIHRVHGLGFAFDGKSFLCLAPSGGGKSSLSLELIRDPKFKILSDDTPLVRDSDLLAFPQRIALKEKPHAHKTRTFDRKRFGRKYIISAKGLMARRGDSAPLHAILILRRGKKPSIEPAARLALAWPLLKWLVMGYETPQIWQLFLRPDLRDILHKTKILASRGRTAWKLGANTRAFNLYQSNSAKKDSIRLRNWLVDPQSHL